MVLASAHHSAGHCFQSSQRATADATLQQQQLTSPTACFSDCSVCLALLNSIWAASNMRSAAATSASASSWSARRRALAAAAASCSAAAASASWRGVGVDGVGELAEHSCCPCAHTDTLAAPKFLLQAGQNLCCRRAGGSPDANPSPTHLHNHLQLLLSSLGLLQPHHGCLVALELRRCCGVGGQRLARKVGEARLERHRLEGLVCGCHLLRLLLCYPALLL